MEACPGWKQARREDFNHQLILPEQVQRGPEEFHRGTVYQENRADPLDQQACQLAHLGYHGPGKIQSALTDLL